MGVIRKYKRISVLSLPFREFEITFLDRGKWKVIGRYSKTNASYYLFERLINSPNFLKLGELKDIEEAKKGLSLLIEEREKVWDNDPDSITKPLYLRVV